MTIGVHDKLKISLEIQASIVDEILERYINDEVGESQQDKFLDMTIDDKISLLTFTLNTCSSWDDFETDLIFNFNFNNY